MRTALPLLLALVALALPVGSAAAALAGGDPARAADLALGLRLFQGALLLHAALLAVAARLRPADPGEPMLPGERPRAGPVTPVEAALLAGIVVGGLALRLRALGDGLWFDEIQTLVEHVRLPLPVLVTTLESQNQHMLFSVLARLSVAAFGETAWALRLPAALLGAASLAALWAFGRRVAGRREALLAAALMAASYHHVWFSQNARGYTGLLLWTLLSTLLFHRLLSDRFRGWGTAAAYGAVAALALWTHVTAAFALAAHALVWLALLARGRGRGAGRWAPGAGLLLSGTLGFALYAPVLPQFVRAMTATTHGGSGGRWQDPAWMVAETLRGLARGLPGGWVALAAGTAVGVAGLVSYARRSPAVLALTTLPVAVTAAAVMAAGHNLWPRFFFFCAGFALLIGIRGVFAAAERLAPRRLPASALATAAGAAAVLASALTVPDAWHPKQDFSGAGAWVEREMADGDAVVAVDMSGFAYARYERPEWPWVRGEEELRAVERAHRRTWVLYTFPNRLSATEPGIWARLQRDYAPAAEFPGTLGGGTVYVRVRR